MLPTNSSSVVGRMRAASGAESGDSKSDGGQDDLRRTRCRRNVLRETVLGNVQRLRRCQTAMELARELHRYVALGMGLGRNGIVHDALRVDLACALYDPYVALQKQIVRSFVQRSVLGVNNRIGLHVMHVADGFIFFGLPSICALSAVSVNGALLRMSTNRSCRHNRLSYRASRRGR